MQRTDIHRPGAIIPAHYTYCMSYNGATSQDGWPIPSQGYNCAIDYRREGIDADGKKTFTNGEHTGTPEHPCCMVYLAQLTGAVVYGSPGKCGCCGTGFVYGDLWRHENGEYLHVGHTCADKYRLLADRSEWELKMGNLRAAAATACERARRKDAREQFLAEHPGLEAALETPHHIVEDIKHKFYGTDFCSLTDNQIKLVEKLADEVAHPEREEEIRAAMRPIENGRYAVEGEVVSTRTDETQFGTVVKMLTKRADGSKVWGTVPSALLVGKGPLKGRRVRFTATFEQSSDDPFFGFYRRPSKAEYTGATAFRAAYNEDKYRD